MPPGTRPVRAYLTIESIELAGGPDRIVTIADMTAADRSVRFYFGEAASAESLTEPAALTTAGELDLPISKTHSLADAAQAHQVLESDRVRSKVVLVP